VLLEESPIFILLNLFPPLNPRINMNIADGRGLKFELIISIFTLWIKSLLGSKLLEDQLHSRV
jgi:hypothetical protein